MQSSNYQTYDELQSSSVVSQMQQYKQKRGDDDYGDGPITAATTERNPQGRVRRDWASMTAAVAE